VPTPASRPDQIARGQDGALWFTEQDANKIGRITAKGHVSELAVPTAASFPSGIAPGPGGIWFTEQGGDRLGRIRVR
jgi:virginiamycin B lyase